MINRVGRYRKTGADFGGKIHIYDDCDQKIICNKNGIKLSVRKRSYNTEKEMLAEFTKWKCHCGSCARILNSRIKKRNIESEQTCNTCKYYDEGECLINKTIDTCNRYEKEIFNE